MVNQVMSSKNKNLNDIRSSIDVSKIENAIAKFESQVDFELVPVIAKKSINTFSYKWVIVLLLQLIGVSLLEIYNLTLWEPLDSHKMILFVFIILILSFIFANILSRIDFIVRLFTPHKDLHFATEEEAKVVFLENKLYKTKANQGLLVFISLLERRILIRPDVNSSWQGCEQVSQNLLVIMQNEFKLGHLEEGLLKSIEFLEKELKDQFPKKNSSSNDIPNKLIFWNFE